MHSHTRSRTVVGCSKQFIPMCFVHPSLYHWCWICCSSVILYVCCSWNCERQPGHKVEHHHGIYCKHFGTLHKIMFSLSLSLCLSSLKLILAIDSVPIDSTFFHDLISIWSLMYLSISTVCVHIHCLSAFCFSLLPNWNFQHLTVSIDAVFSGRKAQSHKYKPTHRKKIEKNLLFCLELIYSNCLKPKCVLI